jgi:hypothetical protein
LQSECVCVTKYESMYCRVKVILCVLQSEV